jgi:predicted nuclease of predicted toxin-antitoxin system
MRFLADESCDFRVVRALRAAGHDVVSILEAGPGAEDSTLMDIALRDRRVFITKDRDFGQLVFAAESAGPGVILLRFPSAARTNLPAVVVELVANYENKIAEHFVVVQPGRIRFTRPPTN